MFAEVEVSAPAEFGVTGELSLGGVGEFGSCSLVFFFLRNPSVGMGASMTRS